MKKLYRTVDGKNILVINKKIKRGITAHEAEILSKGRKYFLTTNSTRVYRFPSSIRTSYEILEDLFDIQKRIMKAFKPLPYLSLSDREECNDNFQRHLEVGYEKSDIRDSYEPLQREFVELTGKHITIKTPEEYYAWEKNMQNMMKEDEERRR